VLKFSKYPTFFLGKKNCKNLAGVGKDLTKFTKILTSESLKIFYNIYIFF
jgi:hypothetical protein